MASPTTNKQYTYPAHGGAVGTWDSNLNGNFEYIDLNLGGYYPITVTSTATTVTYNSSGATVSSTAASISIPTSLAENIYYNVIGTQTQALTINMPAAGGLYVCGANASGGFNVTMQPTGGSGVTILPGSQPVISVTSTGANETASGNFRNISLISTDAGAGSGPLLDLYRNSSSPANGDLLGLADCNGNDSTGVKTAYARTITQIVDVTNGNETATTYHQVAAAGALTTILQLHSSGAEAMGSMVTSGVISGGTAAGSMIAAQAEQETATATDKLVTPGRQQFHPSAAKAWGTFAGATGGLTVSYNVTSVSHDSTGDWTVTLATDFSTANYTVVLGYIDSVDAGAIHVRTQAAGSFTIKAVNLSNTDIDFDGIYFVCYGDQ